MSHNHPSIPSEAVMGSSSVVQYGTKGKFQQGSVEVTFQKPFNSTPVVILTPNWENNYSASYVETVTHANNEGFVITSSNGATNYFVNWIAIGT